MTYTFWVSPFPLMVSRPLIQNTMLNMDRFFLPNIIYKLLAKSIADSFPRELYQNQSSILYICFYNFGNCSCDIGFLPGLPWEQLF